MPRAEKKPIICQDKLGFIPEEYLRFSTPEEVAIYRAGRLKCRRLVEIGSSIGGQTLAFSKTCGEVLCIEIDEKKIKIAEKILKKLEIKNVKILSGDALSGEAVNNIRQFKPDIIFCDTERAEKGDRTIFNLHPDIIEFLKKYSEISTGIAIEAPPFIQDLEKLRKTNNFEAEFISLYGNLNRLTLYFNGLKKADVSGVSLPSGEKIESKKDKHKAEEAKSAEGSRYLYVIDETIISSGLLGELAEKFRLKLIKLESKNYFLGNEKIKSGFLKNYEILGICRDDFNEIIKKLKKLNIGKVVIRYSVSPEKYWGERKKLENLLAGNKKAHLFRGNNKAVICKSENEA